MRECSDRAAHREVFQIKGRGGRFFADRPAGGMPVEATRFIEDHVQTAQKLTAFRGYAGVWGNVLAQARGPFNNRDLFLVDTHAGAGYNASREHPDGLIPGTPLIACHEARRLQNRYPGLRVHVRAIEINARWVAHLRQAIDPFLRAADPRDRVDVLLIEGDFADHVQSVLDEAQRLRAPSLWMVDPYGIKLRFGALHPIQQPARGPEAIINLDLLGIWRVNGAISRAEDPAGDVIVQDYRLQNLLNELFGGDRERWEAVIDRRLSFRENVPALANAYAALFTHFQFRQPHLMLSTRGQARAMIHLCHSDVGARKFRKVFEESQDMGLLAGRRLDQATRSHSAKRYWETYRGQSTTLARLYQEGLWPYDRLQIRAVCFTAAEEGYGRFEEVDARITWYEKRHESDPAVYQPELFPGL